MNTGLSTIDVAVRSHLSLWSCQKNTFRVCKRRSDHRNHISLCVQKVSGKECHKIWWQSLSLWSKQHSAAALAASQERSSTAPPGGACFGAEWLVNGSPPYASYCTLNTGHKLTAQRQPARVHPWSQGRFGCTSWGKSSARRLSPPLKKNLAMRWE